MIRMKFNNGFKVIDTGTPKFLWLLQEKEASENISDICAKYKAIEIRKEVRKW